MRVFKSWTVARGAVVTIAALATTGCANLYSGMSDDLPIATSKDACKPLGAASISGSAVIRANANAGQIRARLTAAPQPNSSLFGAPPSAQAAIVENSPAWLATEVLGSDTHRKIHRLLLSSSSESPLLGAPVGGSATAPLEIKLGVDEFVTYSKALEKVTMVDGWRELEVKAEVQSKALMGASPQIKDDLVDAVKHEAHFLSAYMSAYFRKGRFYSVTLARAKLEDHLRKRLRSEGASLVGLQLPDCKDDPTYGNTPENKKTAEQLINHYSCEVDKKLGELTQNLCKKNADTEVCTVISRISDSGFVTRGGASFAFPVIDVSVDPLADKKIGATKIDTSQVAQDLVRVAVEATGDSLAGVPAVKGSTACETGLLTCFEPAQTGVSADRFARVNDYGDRAEALSASVAGKLVRGISWASLGNEAIAKSLETFLSVSVRKVTEAATWTYVSSPTCAPLSLPAPVLGAGVGIGGGTSIRNLTITVGR